MPILSTSVAYGVYMAVSSNLRYVGALIGMTFLMIISYLTSAMYCVFCLWLATMQLNGIWSSPTLFCYHLMLSSVDQIIRMDIWEKAAMNWPFAFYFLTGLLDLWLVVDVQLLDFFGY